MQRAGPARPAHLVAASLLGLLQTGLGQVYLGNASRSLLLVAALYLIMLCGGVGGVFSRFTGYVAMLGLILSVHLGLAVDAGILAWRRGREKKRYNRWFMLPFVIVLLAGVQYGFLAVREPVLGFAVSRIPSGGMEPTLLIGDIILYDTHCCNNERGPSRGDVVVFRYPLDPSVSYVKRVVGLGGDEIQILAGRLIVNGEVVDEPYLAPGDISSLSTMTVPAGQMYVLGDNRGRSSDSRVWGTVKADAVRGRVTCIVHSPSRKQFGLPIENRWSAHLTSGSSRRPTSSAAAEPGR